MEVLNRTVEEYSIWNVKGYDELIDQWMLMKSPIPILAMFGAYLHFVLKSGPDLMKNRPAFSLNNVLFLYNVFQVAMSIFVFYQGSQLLLKQGLINSVCDLDRNNIQPLAYGGYYYLVAKISELLDTIFFVLRKKYNQVTFLHVYHHALMLVISWYTLKFEPNYNVVFLGTINTFVHIVMYSYYALSTFPALTKYLWWKKYITTMQLVQFGLIILQVAANSYITGCPPSNFLLTMIFFNASLMIYLFSDFYAKAYKENDDIKKASGKAQKESLDRKFSQRIHNNNNFKVEEKTH